MKIKTINLVSIAVGLVGVYFIYDFGKKQGWFEKKKTSTIPTKVKSKTTTVGEGSIPDKKQPTTITPKPSVSKNNYVVTISSGVLNVRQMPNTTSKIQSTLKKGQEIYAQPSKISGWHEILDSKSSFPLVVGYVSSKYVKAK
jgi:uncharacterized protein YgiM (DUF1202 family)